MRLTNVVMAKGGEDVVNSKREDPILHQLKVAAARIVNEPAETVEETVKTVLAQARMTAGEAKMEVEEAKKAAGVVETLKGGFGP